MIKEAGIVLAHIQQSDGKIKTRPVLILKQMPGFGDLLVCGVSHQIHQKVEGFDELLTPDTNNGLRVPSIVRLGFLGTIPINLIEGEIGTIEPELHNELLERLSVYLMN